MLELLELEIQRSAARVAEEGPAAAPLAVAARLAAARKGGEGLTGRWVRLQSVLEHLSGDFGFEWLLWLRQVKRFDVCTRRI